MGHSHDNMEITEFSDVSLEGCLGLLVVFGNLEKECGKEKWMDRRIFEIVKGMIRTKKWRRVVIVGRSRDNYSS